MKTAALVLLFAGACFAQGEAAIKWTLRAGGPAKAGGEVKATLSASIGAGWHLYSMKELEGGPIPTRITVPQNQPFRLAGEIEAPGAIVLHDKNFEMDVEFYVEAADFVLPLQAAAAAPPGPHKLSVTVRYQACNDKLCLPPKNVPVETLVELK